MAKDKGSDTNSTTKTSAANPGKQTELLKELDAIRDRDALQEGMMSFVGFLEDNKAVVTSAIVVALLGALGYVGWNKIGERREKSAQEAFYAVEKPFSEKHEKFEQAKYAVLSGAKVDELVKSEKGAVATGDLAKDYGTLVDDLESFAKNNAGTSAGVQAALMAADVRMQYKQSEQAIPVIEASVKATKSGTLVGALARMAAGNVQAVAGNCDQALKFWEEVLAAKDISFLHSEAALRSGLCLEKSGDKAKAIEMYRKASGDSERSTAAQTARTLLRALELGT